MVIVNVVHVVHVVHVFHGYHRPLYLTPFQSCMLRQCKTDSRFVRTDKGDAEAHPTPAMRVSSYISYRSATAEALQSWWPFSADPMDGAFNANLNVREPNNTVQNLLAIVTQIIK
eukprot:scaffold476834_cov24-Prasinocladus_malaysianus.AAC.1